MGIQMKLMSVQQSLEAPKDQFNDFGKYKYRSCENILTALKPLLAMNQMTILLSDTLREIGGRVYIEATATVTDAETGESISVKALAREEENKKGMDSSQVTGACSSYARKYALNGLFAIDDNKDSDATNLGEGKDTPKTAKAQETAKETKIDDLIMFDKNTNSYFARCSECNGLIRDQKKKDGSMMTIEEYVESCMKVYNRPICTECRKKHGKTA